MQHKSLSLIIVGLSILVSYAPTLYGRVAVAHMGESQNDLLYCMLLPCMSLVLMLGCVIAAWKAQVISLALRVDWVSQRKRWDILWGCVLASVALATVGGLLHVSIIFDIPRSPNVVLHTQNWGRVFTIAYVVRLALAGAFVEEVFWRGYVQTILQQRLGSRTSILIQATFFSLVHLYGFVGTVQAFLFGLIVGTWRWRRQTLVPVILAHAIWNSVYLVPFVYEQRESHRIAKKYGGYLEELGVPPGHASSENASHHYERAVQLLDKRLHELGEREIINSPSGPIADADSVRVIRNWISAHPEVINEFEEGTRKRFYAPAYSAVPFKDIVGSPLWPQYREIVVMLLSRAQIEAAEGNLRQSLCDIMSCHRFGWHLRGPKPLNEQLFGLGIQEYALRTMLLILWKKPSDEQLLESVQAELKPLAREETIATDYRGERVVLDYIIESIFGAHAIGAGRVREPVLDMLLQDPKRASYGEETWRELRKDETIRLANDIFAYLDSIRGRTPAELYQTNALVEDVVSRIADGNPLLRWQMDGYQQYFYETYRYVALRNALFATVGILRYRLDHGSLPESLNHLARASYVDGLPADPFSDSSLVYKQLRGGFLLYSLGSDFDDDGGTNGTRGHGVANGDDVFWPVATISPQISQPGDMGSAIDGG